MALFSRTSEYSVIFSSINIMLSEVSFSSYENNQCQLSALRADVDSYTMPSYIDPLHQSHTLDPTQGLSS